ncbi:hypothetical protein DFH09DRAFT_1094443 [Mycena vulgaris]|nr:hypothetical protein DFH09DRAFT_1094443 [Mycena vulgaris]
MQYSPTASRAASWPMRGLLPYRISRRQHANTQRKLRAYVAPWRGVSAISPVIPSSTLHAPSVFPAPPPRAPHPTAPSPVIGVGAPAPRPTRCTLPRPLRPPLSSRVFPAPRSVLEGAGEWGDEGERPDAASGTETGKRKGREGQEEARTRFAIFATRALKEAEEIVVRWKRDDGNAVHRVGEVAGAPLLRPSPHFHPPYSPPRYTLSAMFHTYTRITSYGSFLPSTPHTADARSVPPHHAGREYPARARRRGCVCAASFDLCFTSTSTPFDFDFGAVRTSHPSRAPHFNGRKKQEKEEEEEKGGAPGEGVGERDCVVRAMETVVFPPVQPQLPSAVYPSHHPYNAHPSTDEEMDVDVNGRGVGVGQGTGMSMSRVRTRKWNGYYSRGKGGTAVWGCVLPLQPISMPGHCGENGREREHNFGDTEVG